MPGRLDCGGDPADVEFQWRLVAAQAGEEWAVAVIFREHNPSLLRYLRAQEMSAADDLAAEVSVHHR